MPFLLRHSVDLHGVFQGSSVVVSEKPSGGEAASGVRIRRAGFEDARRLRNLHRVSIQGLCAADYTPEQIDAWVAASDAGWVRRAMEAGEVVFVAERGARIVGFSSFFRTEVRAVYVRPGYTRQGMGARLLQAVEAEAGSRGIAELRLNASLTAVPFYEALGYRVLGRGTHCLPTGVLLPCVRMVKRLND